MTKRTLIALVSTLAVACGEDAGSGGVPDAAPTFDAPPQQAPDAAPVSVVLESRFGPAADTLGDGVAELATALRDHAGLNVTVRTPPAGMDVNRILDRVNAGTLDLGVDVLTLQTSGLSSTLDEVLDFYGESIPFGLQGEEYLSWLHSGGTMLLVEKLRAKGYADDLVIVPVLAAAGQAAGMFKGPASDARFQTGFLMRTFGYGQLVMKEAYPNMKFIGAVGGGVANIVAGFAGTLSGPDCSQAGADPCELGGAEFTYPCPDVNQIYTQGIAANGVTHYYLSHWQSPATVLFLFYRKNNAKLAGLDSRIQLVARASVAETQQRLLARQSECTRALVETYDQTISTLPQDVLVKLRAATIVVLDRIAAGNPDAADVLAHQRAFVAKNQAWWNHGYLSRTLRFVGWGTAWESAIPVE
jgi:TRAP-type mannitol/chloroaromatic compound transport system substrate-binding protein